MNKIPSDCGERGVKVVHGYLDDGHGNIEVRFDGKYTCVCGHGFDTVDALRTHIRALEGLVRIADMAEDERDRLRQQMVERIERLERVQIDLDNAIAALQEARAEARIVLEKYQQIRQEEVPMRGFRL